MKKPNWIRHAFTLIELLIVVAIIGILAAIAVPNFIQAQLRAKLAKVQSEQRSIRDAYLMYKTDNNGWPKHIDGDLAQHRFVTTPIAYLSSSLDDPFFNQQLKDNSAEWGWFKGQYHLEPAYFWHTGSWPSLSQNEPAFWGQQRNTAFFVMSIGPDKVFEMQTPHADRYDPSNGATSSGDIILPVPGGFKATYPYVLEDWTKQ